mmetsp:Transcript_79708/g.125716  ORF Transcript_79708/g.125716 Transcript_79708/m.125716 type:complete len:111 (+) Transcript_79708:179-511(+)
MHYNHLSFCTGLINRDAVVTPMTMIANTTALTTYVWVDTGCGSPSKTRDTATVHTVPTGIPRCQQECQKAKACKSLLSPRRAWRAFRKQYKPEINPDNEKNSCKHPLNVP